MELKKQVANPTPQMVVAAGKDFFIINPKPSQVVFVTLADDTPDGTFAWIPLNFNEGLNRSTLGAGSLWLKAAISGSEVALAKEA